MIRLEQNYRSTQTILDAANEVISPQHRPEGQEPLDNQNGEGEKIVLRQLPKRAGAKRRSSSPTRIEEDVADEGMKYSAITPFCYRMNAQSGVLEQYFIKAGIPYRLFGGAKFFERKEIRDLVAYLSVINNPSDTVRLRRIVNEPKRSIGEATLNTAEEIAAKSRSSMFQVFRDAEKYSALSRKAGALMSFAGIIDGLREAAKEEPLDLLLDDILEKTGYGAMLNAQGEEGKTRMENIGELKSTMVKYEQANPEGSLSGFLEEIALYTDLDSMSDADDLRGADDHAFFQGTGVPGGVPAGDGGRDLPVQPGAV